jgi:hypothetical protein
LLVREKYKVNRYFGFLFDLSCSFSRENCSDRGANLILFRSNNDNIN